MTDRPFDDDFLAAPSYAAAPSDDAVEDFLSAPDYAEFPSEELDEDANWRPELGFPDGTRAIRVWADDDGVLTRVRVSLNWREKLADSSLDAAFFTAFMAMNAILHTHAHPLPSLEPLAAEPFPGPAGWHTLQLARQQHAELDARNPIPDDAPPTRWVGEPASGSAYENGVVVTLGIHGQPVSARFDPAWVTGPVRSSEIARGVMAAYQQARRRHVPPTVEFGARELLAREHDRITRSMLATLRHGIEI